MRPNKTFYIFVLVTVLFLSHQSVTARQNIMMENVLKIDFVLQDFLQDDDGFFWIASNNGLFRYDGFQTKYFNKATNDLESNVVISLAKDRQGLIWIATRGGGLTVFNKMTNTFKTYRHLNDDIHSILSDSLSTIFIDQKNKIWIGTDTKGISLFDPGSTKFFNYAINFEKQRLVQNESAKENFITDIIEDQSGFIWIAVFGKGVIRVNPDTMAFDHYIHDETSPNSIGGNYIFSMSADDNGHIWLGGDESSGLSDFNPKTDQFTIYKHDPDNNNSISNGNIREIYKERNNLWLGHFFGGISILNLKTGRINRIKKGAYDKNNLRSDTITKIMKDRSGIFWIACLSGEVEKYNPFTLNFNSFENNPNNSASLSNNVVMVIYGDQQNNVWIGTGNGGLNRFNRETNTFTRYKPDKKRPDSLPSPIVTHIFEDSLQRLWVSTSDVATAFFCQFDYRKNKCQKIYRHKKNDKNSIAKAQRVRAVIEDIRHPGILWIAYDTNLFDRFDTQTQTFTHFTIIDNHAKGSKPEIWDMLQDETGKLWFSTYHNGLISYDLVQNEFQSFYHAPDDVATLNTDQLSGMLIDSKKRFWIGTNDGFARFFPDTGKSKRYYLKNTLYNDNTIIGIVEDMNGILWLPSNGGLARFDPETEAIKIFTKQDGLQSNAFFYKSFCKTPDGELWFGGLNGVNSFFPKHFSPNTHKPNIVLTSVKIGNEELKFNTATEKINKIHLTWQNNYFEFEYAGLEYSQPHLNQYKYKLEGLDPDWVDAGNRRYGRYTGLPGGTYDLKIIGSNNEGFWNNEGITIKITVDKPFWKTWYFYNAIIAVTIILFLMIIFYVARLLKEIKVRKITENALFISREDLRKTNKFLEAVVKQAPFGIEVLKINEDKWDMLLVNKEACNIKLQPDLSKYRTGKGELHSWKILDPDNQPFIFTKSSIIDSIRNANFTKLDELQIVRKDNSRRWITYNVSPILDGQSKVVGGLIIYSDITHRKQAENKTRRVKNQLREIINMMPSVLIGIDHQHNITHWNHHAASMTSLTEDTVVGKSFFSQFPGSKDLLNIIENTIKNKKVLQLDKMLTSINEQTRHINLTVYPFGLNEIDRFVIKMDDITQHVKMEEIVIQNEKMMMIGGLAAGMAHEINNPLSAIMQGAQNIGRRLSPDMAANQKIAIKHEINLTHVHRYMKERQILIFLEGIRNSSLRASKIVSNMLHFSKRSKTGSASVSIHDVIDKSIELAANDYELKHTYQFEKIKILRHYFVDLPSAFCDETQIEQVFINLLKNAAQALKDSTQTNPTITITTQLYDSDIHILFEDNGPGMEKEQQKRIFEPFFTTKSPQEGTGLGLFVSFIIITNIHKGSMAVESKIDEWTHFKIKIPVSHIN